MALLSAAAALLPFACYAQREHENEVVANLAGGRVVVQVSRELISFAVIDHPIETPSHTPPRVLSLDATHVGVLFGAEEWEVASDPKPVRLDRNFMRSTKVIRTMRSRTWRASG
jgi:hypothetical protein